MLGWVWVGVFFCGGKDWVFGSCDCWVFCCCFFYLNHDKVKLEFITKVISDIAICKFCMHEAFIWCVAVTHLNVISSI